MRTWMILLALLLAAPLGAQQARLNLDLPALAARADQVSDVTLDGAALRMGIAFIGGTDTGMSPADRDMLSHLKGIYVKSFEFDHAGTVGLRDLEPIRAQLKAGGWTRLVSVHSSRHDKEAESDEVYLLSDAGGAIQGMTILAVEPKELNVVNIVGPIQPSELATLGGHLGIPAIEAGPAKGGH